MSSILLDQSAATALLKYMPLPNIAKTASGQNFHYVTSAEGNSDSVNLSYHNLAQAAARIRLFAEGRWKRGAGVRRIISI